MAEIADLMVKIGGDASGLESALKGARGAVEGVASGMKSVGVGLTAAVTVPLVALGAAAMKASADVGGAYRSIQRETGATGTELAGLKTAFDTVFKTVPASADDVATALTRITQTLDLTTAATGVLATQFLNLSRMTGTDLTTNINSASEAFNAWGDKIPDVGFALDALYTISQQTGQSVSDISSTLALAAGPAQAAGLGYQETAILVAQLGQAGVPAKQIISSLTAVIKDATTNNVSAATEWQNLVNKFKDPAYKATADDMAILGNNTTKFALAARNGDLDYGPLLQKIKDSPNAINDMAAKTGTLSEALTLLKNRAELALKPLGDSIYGVAKDIVKGVDPIMTVVENLGKAFDKLPAPVKQATVVLGALAASSGPVIAAGGSMMQMLTPLLLNLGTLSPVLLAVGIPLAAVGVAFGALAVGLGIAYTASATFRGVLGTLTTAFTTFGGSVMKAITQLTSGDFTGALDTLRTALNQLVVDLSTINWSSVGDKIKTEIANAFSDKSSTLNTIADQIHKMIDAVPWAQLGQELGQAMGEMLSIGFDALTGTGDTGSGGDMSSLEMAMITGTGGSGGGGFAGLKEAGKTAAGSFVGGFEQGLKDGMSDINWAAVIAALWDGLYNLGPQVMGKDKNLFSYMAGGGAGDNSDAMREWILKQLPSWETIRDTIGKWWDDLVKQVGTWWDNIPWGNLFGGGGKSTGKGAAMIDIPAKLSVVIDFLAGAGKAIYDFITGGAGKIISATINFLAGAGKAIYDFITGSGAGKAISATVNFIKGVGQELWNVLTGVGGAIKNAINLTVNFLKGVGGDLYDLIIGGATKAISIIVSIANNVRTLITNAIGGAYNFVVQLASNVRGIITSAIGGAYNFLLNLASDARSMVTASIGGAYNFLLNLVSDARSMITASIGGAFGILIQIANDVRGAISTAIGGAFDATVNVIAHLLGGGGITEWVGSKLGGWGLGIGAKPVTPPTPVPAPNLSDSSAVATGAGPSGAPMGGGASGSSSAAAPASYPTSSGCGPGYYFVQCSTCPPGVGSCQPAGAEGFKSGGTRLAVYGEAGPEARVPKAMWGMPWDYVLSHVPIANRATLAVPGSGGPEAFIPKAMWGKPWGNILSSLPKLQGGAVSGGTQHGSGSSCGDKHVHYHINIQDPILKEEITEERLIKLLRRSELLHGGWL